MLNNNDSITMKRCVILILLVVPLLLLSGCSLLLGEGDVFCSSYVLEYDDIDYQGEAAVVVCKDLGVVIDLPRKLYACQNIWQSDDSEKVELHTKHQELSHRNGDVGFNTWGWGLSDSYPHASVWNTDNLITSITAVSDVDFDADHPAGVNLGDIVEIAYITHKPFIDNGYKHSDKLRAINDYTGYKQRKLLVDFTSEDSQFTDSEHFYVASDTAKWAFELFFMEMPTQNAHHTISVTFNFERGPYTVEFDLDFGQPNS